LKDKKLPEEVPIGVLDAKNKKGFTQEEQTLLNIFTWH